MNIFPLPEHTGIAFVELRVPRLSRSLDLYARLLGFHVASTEPSRAFLSASEHGPPRIILTETRNARPRARGSTGLFHLAILFPSRKELARAFTRLYQDGYPLQGVADHGVSEAIYLGDPDGNGIELYADRPTQQWPYANGSLGMITKELDVENLLAELKNDKGSALHPDIRIGHVHLQVSDLEKAEEFYHRLVGFDVTQRSYPGALFVSAGGYHHHIGMNIWNSRGGSPPPPNSVGLIRFGVEVPDLESFGQIRDRLTRSGATVENEETTGAFVVHDFDETEIEFMVKPAFHHLGQKERI